MITICHVCSLGTLCQSSQLLKDTHLKEESYPFDWIFSSPSNIIDIIEDNFSKFLNTDLYLSVNPHQCSHTIYCNYMFNHHNPKDNELDYNYFIRCVDRFRKLLCTQSNKLFVITFPDRDNDLKYIESIKQQIIEFNKYISTKTSNYYIFVIYHIVTQDSTKIDILDIDNIKFVKFYTKSNSNGIRLTNPVDNELLKKCLLDSYSFKYKKYNIILTCSNPYSELFLMGRRLCVCFTYTVYAPCFLESRNPCASYQRRTYGVSTGVRWRLGHTWRTAWRSCVPVPPLLCSGWMKIKCRRCLDTMAAPTKVPWTQYPNDASILREAHAFIKFGISSVTNTSLNNCLVTA